MEKAGSLHHREGRKRVPGEEKGMWGAGAMGTGGHTVLKQEVHKEARR